MATVSERRNRQGQLIGWQAKIRRHGWPVQSRTFRSRRDAEAWATTKEAEMIRGIFVDRRPAERVTLYDAIETYITEVVPAHKGGTTESLRLRRFQRDELKLCQHAMAQLTAKLFVDYRDRRIKEVAPGTVKREFNLLNSVIEAWRRNHPVIENPLRDVKRPSVDDERDVRLTPKEWARLLKACAKETIRGKWESDGKGGRRPKRNTWLAPAVELLKETGARRSELLRWRWDDTDLKAAIATFRDVKNSRDPAARIDRSIGLSPRAVQILRKLRRSPDGRVIPLTFEALKQSFERARTAANLEHFRMHDLRHEMASSRHEEGWSPVEVMAQGGWRDPKSMKRYSNLTAAHLARRFRHQRV